MSATVVSMKLPASRSARCRRCRPRSCAGRRGRAACGRPRGGTGCRTGCATASTRPANGVESVWAVGVEALGQPRDRVAVAHPDRLLALDAGEQAVVRGDADVGRAVLAVVGREDVAAELVGHQLRAVADAEDGDAAGPDGRVGPRRVRVVDRVRAARQDDRARAAPLELVVRRVVRQQLRVDVELADAPRDELRELAAEVEDDDGLAVDGGRRSPGRSSGERSGAGALSAVSR